MPFFFKYPSTDFSQLNLDYFCNKLVQIEKTLADVVARIIRLENNSSGGGTDDYEDLENKPQINAVTLAGNKTTSDLGIDADSVGAIEAPDLTGASAGWYLRLAPNMKWVALPGASPPVSSVNNKTGAVILGASDVGAIASPVSPQSGDVLMWNGAEWEASNFGTVFTIKGEVADISDLPATGNNVGDVYFVSSVSAGYIWIETTDHPAGYWEELGEPIDLSGYIEKPQSPAQNDVLTFDGTDWIAQAPGGETERAWSLLQTIDIAQHGSGSITINNLDNYTEFMCFGSKVKNSSSTQSGYTITVNGTDISSSGVTIAKSTTDQYNWCYIFYDGMFWHVCHHQPTINNNYVAGGNLLVPYFFKENIGKCTTFKLSAPATAYQAVSGTIKIWGR